MDLPKYSQILIPLPFNLINLRHYKWLRYMLQVSEIRAHKSAFVQRLTKRGIVNGGEILTVVIDLDDKRKELQAERDNVQAEANLSAKKIGALMKAGNKPEAEEAKMQAAAFKSKSVDLTKELNEVNEQMTSALYNIPNIPNEIVPNGTSDEDNEVLQTVDQLLELPDTAVPHWDLIAKYDIIDFELGNKITGAGFPVYKGMGARLQRALINFFLDEAISAGYAEVQPPIVINEASGYGTGQLPDKEGQMYQIADSDLYMIPTAEVPITNMYRDVILNEKDLPIMKVGHTPCFRREAGSWGAHVRGLNRLHQFDKVEIVQIRRPEESYKALEEMMGHVEGLLKKLELPYRILRLCGGDLGFTAAITYDFEVYSAGQKRWLEVSSVSNFETYQANRLKLRYKGADKKKQLLHTLNGSALALPRILATILENNQEQDHILIPEVLRKYTGFDRITK